MNKAFTNLFLKSLFSERFCKLAKEKIAANRDEVILYMSNDNGTRVAGNTSQLGQVLTTVKLRFSRKKGQWKGKVTDGEFWWEYVQ